eukprot:PhM_4_TR10284/c0_g2_i1/m.57117/K16605/TPGS2; tubulin polyglutamylase complex subunit 2
MATTPNVSILMENYVKKLNAVANTLQQFPAIKDVSVKDSARGTQAALIRWEHRNSPYALPADLREFLMAADGVRLSWGLEVGGHVLSEVGCLEVNSFASLTPVKDEDFFRRGPERVAFELDSCPQALGRAVLHYLDGNYDSPQVWFIAADGCWHFVADSFSAYFRLALLNQGIPGWCYAYTAESGVGVPPVTWELMAYLVPERLREVSGVDRQSGETVQCELDVDWLLEQNALLKQSGGNNNTARGGKPSDVN